MEESGKKTRFELFCEQLDLEKEEAQRWAWFVLVEALRGVDVSRLQFDAAKEVLDRLEGKATQKNVLVGESNLPIILRVVNDDGERKGD